MDITKKYKILPKVLVFKGRLNGVQFILNSKKELYCINNSSIRVTYKPREISSDRWYPIWYSLFNFIK